MIEDCDELMDMLTGKDLPEGMAMRHQPSLSRQQGFSVIWFLQEHMHLLPDNIEMCSVCEELFDHSCEGFIIDGTDTPDDWQKERGITKKMLEQNDGTMFCSAGCEQQYWHQARLSLAPVQSA